MQRKRTGGEWDPAEGPIYFISSTVNDVVRAGAYHPWVLVALNYLESRAAIDATLSLIARGAHVLLDSGIFSLAMRHAQRRQVPLERVIAGPPEDIEGFAALVNRYCDVIAEMGAHAWGHIEIDLGGPERKRQTRAMLEKRGLAPIPVYHPLSDPPAYLDELGEQYDRIGIGNFVSAAPPVAKRLQATLHAWRERHPGVWLHGLGLSPTDCSTVWPLHSMDSSSFLAGVRWGRTHAQAACKTLWVTGLGWTYDQAVDNAAPRGSIRARALAGVEAAMLQRTWRLMMSEQNRTLGIDLIP